MDNYIEVPKKYWKELRMNTFIKYMKDDEMKGGMILRNPYSAWNQEKNENTDYFKLYFSSNREKNWLVEYDKIQFVYIKRNIIMHLMLKEQINKMSSNIKLLGAVVRRLELEVHELKKNK